MDSLGRTVLVTGAARGIGLACVQRFLQTGHKVVMVDRDAQGLEGARSRLPSADVLAITADLTDRRTPELVYREIREKQFGPVSILVNNAGISPKHAGRGLNILEIDTEEWDLVLEINLSAAMLMSRRFLPDMCTQNWGRVVNMSSLAGRGKSEISGPAYMASKAGLLGLTRHIAVQFGKYGVTANAVAPGRVATELAAQLDPEMAARAVAQNPLGREGEPRDVAAAVCFLASEDARFCNGAVIDVNGGLLML